MIRYPITQKRLRELLENENPGWLKRADEKTKTFRKLGRYEEKSSIWSAVKPVYMELQGGSKCAYCERKMEWVKLGRGEQDVEHFRPKGRVTAWRVPKQLKELGLRFTAPPKDAKGYYLLPYHILNYAASCKPCNSSLKGDRFPIAGTYKLDATKPTGLAAENAYLIYPIGTIDIDPEKLIEFHGVAPRPVAESGHNRDRALTTIVFFKLDDPSQRKNLFRDRALVIMGLHPLLEKAANGSAADKKVVEGFLKPTLPHLNCAKSFARLFDSDRSEAQAIYDAAVKLLSTVS